MVSCNGVLTRCELLEFQDIFDVDYFMALLREDVQILKELPPRLKRIVEQGYLCSMLPVSWSDLSYYHKWSKEDRAKQLHASPSDSSGKDRDANPYKQSW